MQAKYVLLIILVAAVFGYGMGRYVQPAKIVTKTETKTQTVTVDRVNTVTVTKQIPMANGKTEIITIVKDKSEVDTNSQSDTKSQTMITNTKPQWKVRADLAPWRQDPGDALGMLIAGSVERRIIGPIWAGVTIQHAMTVGLTVGMEF